MLQKDLRMVFYTLDWLDLTKVLQATGEWYDIVSNQGWNIL